MRTTLERFIAKVKVRPNGCWEWQASRNNKGYAMFRDRGQHWLGHRWAFVYIRRRQIPKGKELDHVVCDYRACVNPAHVEPRTHRENMMRSVKAQMNARRQGERMKQIKLAITHCPLGHEYTDENTWRNKRGHRWCRMCNRLRQQARRAAE
jgi:hypothetical protein